MFKASLTSLAAAAVLLLSFTASVRAVQLTDVSQYGASKSYAAAPMYRWAAAVSRTDYFTDAPSVTRSASCIAIAPDVYINAGHFTPRDNSLVAFQTEIAFSSNYNTSTDRYSVRKTQRYPGYVLEDPSTVDLGVGWTNSFIAGFTQPTVFGSPAVGDQVSQVATGITAIRTPASLPSIGDRLGGYAPVVTNRGSEYPETYYFHTQFQYDGYYGRLNVHGLNYDSGSPCYSATGELLGLDIAGTPGTGTIAQEIFLRLNTPEVQAYLQPIIADSWARYNASLVPEPGTLAAVALAISTLMRRRRSHA